MEFRFDVNDLFKQNIVEINANLIPPGFCAPDRRALWDGVTKVSEVINKMGEASATAQGLTKPITTSDKLRNSEHKIYLLIDNDAKSGKGIVTGMLKVGRKGLYVFDRDGHHFQVTPPCVLDFYIHETRQRTGLGKKLFEHMLEKEEIEPVKMAIDRPSDKFLAFLNKHYKLQSPIKQMNNYVVFDGFFPEANGNAAPAPPENEDNTTPTRKQTANGLQSGFAMAYGRYGAPRPPCSMGQIIHNQSPLAQQAQEPTGEPNPPKAEEEVEQETEPAPPPPAPKLERPQSLSLEIADDSDGGKVGGDVIESKVPTPTPTHDLENGVEKIKLAASATDGGGDAPVPVKNGDAAKGAEARKTPSHLTEQGFFDLKFYHNKLW